MEAPTVPSEAAPKPGSSAGLFTTPLDRFGTLHSQPRVIRGFHLRLVLALLPRNVGGLP